MTLRISDNMITSTDTVHVAWRRREAAADQRCSWTVSWLPNQLMTENDAILAMKLAEVVSQQCTELDEQAQHTVNHWAQQLYLTGPDAVARIRLTTNYPHS